jgi:ATP-dependent DNA helicase RecG
VLEIAEISKSRKDLLLGLSLVNNANNFENYIQSLIAINWITMTIPDKPTSPNQKYLTTLKGRLVLEILKKQQKMSKNNTKHANNLSVYFLSECIIR